ncbi:MAG: 2-C-methyl-D-erythritol 4-phosphate cytidylyltransferase, partial [Clostridia bacterium]|nr:2-C-methyl-D-erythritol 4-phosphate cytidylyltransferase [Clostridia bacterium]
MINFPKDKNKKVSAVIAAAGNSIRMNGTKSKQFIEINGRPAIAYTLEAFEKSRYTDEIIIVTRENDILFMSDIVKSFGISKVTDIVTGGNSRTESVKNGLIHAKGEIVAIHDGARICITPELIDKVIKTASETKAAALGCRLTDTLKLVDENNT